MWSPVRKTFQAPSRRSTAPADLQTPASPTASSRLPWVNAPGRLQNSGLPTIERRSLKKFRKYYIANLSSKNGSTHDQSIISAAYFQSEGPDLKSIRLETVGNKSGARGVLILESPRPNKGLNMPRMFRTLSQSNAVKSIANIVPIAPNLGHFRSIPCETRDGQAPPVPSGTPIDTITYQTPLPLDNLIVLASKISSRRSRRSLQSPSRGWFILAMWEGLKRLQSLHEGIPPVDLGVSTLPNSSDTPADIQALVDGVMPTFGNSLLLLHHKVLKIQQKRDHTMSASQELKQNVRQEIDERNEDFYRTQANSRAAEQEMEELRRREILLQKQTLRRPTVA
ncbi:unnamed protein product [Rhizoctonia solani]|uniref:Uncharacterized protein n=1 Tax=Rhizoctonia solani TaxID=456999 RepID=A0A8H3BRV5_9AGAM|nr:unnamed protein product [Rhizoctonia solani]